MHQYYPRIRCRFLSPILPLLLLLLLPDGVVGQIDSTIHSTFTWPDLTDFRTILPIILIILTTPYYCTTLVLIWRRRKQYPIAGRGSTYLFALNVMYILSALWQNLIALFWPLGLPCGLQFVTLIGISVPICIAYMCRSWILAYRLEIMNYLEEIRWRQEKSEWRSRQQQEQQQLQLQQHVEESDKQKDGKMTDATHDDKETDQTRVKIDPSDEEIDTDPTQIPGYWFIVHRQYTEPRYINRFIYSNSLFVLVGGTLLGIFDPDVQLFDDSFRSRGLLPEDVSLGSQFTYDGFWGGAPCIVYSVKMFFFVFLFGFIAVPVVMWVVWRLFLDAKRRRIRAADQKATIGTTNATGTGTGSTANGDGDKSKAGSGIELDDSSNVKIELFCILQVGGIGLIGYFILTAWSPSWSCLVEPLIFIVAHYVSITLPLRMSYAISRHHRAKIDGSRNKKNHGSISNKSDLYSRLPHQRPFYSPKYILRNPDTYRILLSFLQKEYSSENALFWSESRRFEHACREMELRIPTWPRSLGGEEGSGENQSNTNTVGKRGEELGGKHIKTTRTASIAGHNSPMVTPINVTSGTIAGGALGIELTTPTAPCSPISPGAISVPSASAANRTVLAQMSVVSTASPSPPTSSHRPEYHHQHMPSGSLPTSLTMSNGSGGGGGGGNMLNLATIPTTLTMSLGVGGVIDTPDTMRQLHAQAHGLKVWANRIYDSYLARSSMFEINLPEDLSRLVASQLKQLAAWEPSPDHGDGVKDTSHYPMPPPFPLSTLYKQTNHSVFELIASDSFRRFILTPAFAALLAKADEDELARLENQHDLEDDTKAVIDRAMEQFVKGTTNSPKVGPSASSFKQHTSPSIGRSQCRSIQGRSVPIGSFKEAGVVESRLSPMPSPNLRPIHTFLPGDQLAAVAETPTTDFHQSQPDDAASIPGMILEKSAYTCDTVDEIQA